MKIATVDLETYWAVGHSLTKMSPIKYCMHPETEIISCAFKFDDEPTVVVFGEQAVIDYCAKVDWSQYWVVGHNLSGFDSMILSWRLGVKPMLWGCTLAMARPIHAKDVGLSLAKLVAHYGLGHKDQSALVATKGKHLCDFSADEISEMSTYNAADVDQCYGLLRRLIPQTQKAEVKLIDMTIRMLIEPYFEADVPLLANTLADEGERKQAMLIEAASVMGVLAPGMNDDEAADAALKVLSSAAKFATFLRTIGVEVPTKISLTTEKEIPALAKTDEAFLALQEHDDPLVAMAAAARLDAKSTILQTRIQAFLTAADAQPQRLVPIPLKYYGADTTGRWSGWGYNPQNLPRINPYKPKPSDALRKSLRAPEGHKVVVADLSGIELRVNHFLWQVPSSMKLFQDDPEKADLYKDFASTLYNVPVADVTKVQRQVGKVAHLGLGFGAGYITFQKVAKLMGGVDITEDESRDIVDKWRGAYPEICQGWRTCHASLKTIMSGAEGAAVDPWGMVFPTTTGLKTPKGLIRYPDLRTERDDNNRVEFMYGQGRNKARIYAGKIDENIVQHLARCVIADNALSVQAVTGLNPALMVHDELVYVVPQEAAQTTLDTVQEIMRTPPTWWPELVTWSEGDIAQTYGEAK
jgi:DNA polymerase I-like protein with 3'-5' exonuclease and polymerase domains